MTTQFLAVEGGNIAYRVSGNPEAQPIILIHGWLEDYYGWDSTIAFLKNQYYCISLDLFGFGQSDKPLTGDYTIHAQARRVVALADALNLERFYLIGHSMGGQIALTIASQIAPERVIRLISVAGVVSGAIHPATMATAVRIARLPLPLLQTVTRLSRPLRELRWWSNRQFKPSFYKIKTLPFERWQPLRYSATLPGTGIAMKKAGESILATDITAYLAAIPCPVLALFGKYDHVVMPSEGQLVADHVPQGEVMYIEQCGHFPNWEKPEMYESIMTAYLRGNEIPQ